LAGEVGGQACSCSPARPSASVLVGQVLPLAVTLWVYLL